MKAQESPAGLSVVESFIQARPAVVEVLREADELLRRQRSDQTLNWTVLARKLHDLPDGLIIANARIWLKRRAAYGKSIGVGLLVHLIEQNDAQWTPLREAAIQRQQTERVAEWTRRLHQQIHRAEISAGEADTLNAALRSRGDYERLFRDVDQLASWVSSGAFSARRITDEVLAWCRHELSRNPAPSAATEAVA